MRRQPALAPAIKAAFRKIVAPQVRGSSLAMEPSSAMAGRFWDSDSESECEDLGFADDIGEVCKSVVAGVDGQGTTTEQSTKHVQSAASDVNLHRPKPTKEKGSQHAPPPGIRWPWTKPWNGPLPKRPNTAVTLADFLPVEPRRSSAVLRPSPVDPKVSDVQNSN